MPKAHKLPSGAWRTRVYDASEKKYKSFTAETKKDSEYAAAKWLTEYDAKKSRRKNSADDITLAEAFKRYIDSKSAILSPGTLRTYVMQSNNYLLEIMNVKLSELTNEAIQNALNTEAEKGLSPKSLRNISGLLSAVLREYLPEFSYHVKLPQKEKVTLYIPTDEEVSAILDAAKGTDMEIPMLLAAHLGLRKSEILGLKWDCVNLEKGTIEIKEAKVSGIGGMYSKAPKTFSGYRTLTMDDQLREALSNSTKSNSYVVNISRDMMYKKFIKILDKLKINHFRFHDLRHYNASVMLKLGIPNKYAMARMGHATDNMLQQVYQHIMDDKMTEVNDLMNKHFKKKKDKI